eukprot:15462902-Alexandrium_andersonii.AAC.1
MSSRRQGLGRAGTAALTGWMTGPSRSLTEGSFGTVVAPADGESPDSRSVRSPAGAIRDET